jgi:hypothetical protein
MDRLAIIFLVSLLLSSLSVAIKAVAANPTVVKVDPSLIEYYEDATNQQFTVAIKVVDVTNLYGFDIKFRWNTTFLDYVSHSVRVPRDTYPDGLLWNPIIQIMNEVNTTAGTYWIAYTSRWPAPSFNGSGTVFTMTFMVKHHPVQPEPTANIELELYSTDLSDNGANPIPHTKEDGAVILYAISARHDLAVSNVKPWKTIVGQGYICKINVTAINEGDSPENFTLTLYANTTIIVTLANITLASQNSAILTFTWNTTSLVKGNYTISANITQVPGETDLSDNTSVNGVVFVGVPCDITGPPPGAPDGISNMRDIGYIASKFGTTPSSPNWDPNADVTGPTPRTPDNMVNMRDIGEACANFGNTDP